MNIKYNRRKFLVVDDFSEMRKAIKRMIEAFGGVDIDEAKDGKQAIHLMEKRHFNIVLCDYNLGEEKNGQQILEEAKHRNLLKSYDIFIMITAETSTEMVLSAIDYKPDDYISKPFTRNALKLRLDRVAIRKDEFMDIDLALEQQDYARALTVCDQRIESGSRNYFGLLKVKGETLLLAGEYQAAQEIYQQVLDEREQPWAKLGLGQSCYYLKDYAGAERQFQELLNENRLNMDAYDWLAKLREAQGDSTAAQEVLMGATKLSPKSMNRQKDLGQLAYRNEDFSIAEKSYRTVVRLGKNSYLKSVDNHHWLAKSLTANGSDTEALQVLRNARKEFRQSDDEIRQSAMLEGTVLQKLGRDDEAQKAIARASSIGNSGQPASAADTALEQARFHIEMGEKDKAVEILKRIVRNHHDDEEVLARVQELFDEMGLGDEGGEIVTSIKDEMVQLNNKGVRLAREGQLNEAIMLFEEAVQGMPDNRVINLNAAQVLIMHMEENGVNEKHKRQSWEYLERVAKIEPENEKYRALVKMYHKLSS